MQKAFFMFTGLIEQLGHINEINSTDTGVTIEILVSSAAVSPVIGASISISGCCLSVVESRETESGKVLVFDVIPETLSCTTICNYKVGHVVNVEEALQLDSKLGGHFVQGHIDGVEEVLEINPSACEEEVRYRFSLNNLDSDVIVNKGSVAIDGVSLTIANVTDQWFEVAIIPLTHKMTTFQNLKVGDSVNVETDILAKTVANVVRKINRAN